MDHAMLISVAEQMMGSLGSRENPDVPVLENQNPHSKIANHAILEWGTRLNVGHPAEVVVEGRAFRVARTGARRFRTVRFVIGRREYQAIEQNAEKPSRWGKLAREGHRVVQFRDLLTHKYVAVAVDDRVIEYGR